MFLYCIVVYDFYGICILNILGGFRIIFYDKESMVLNSNLI